MVHTTKSALHCDPPTKKCVPNLGCEDAATGRQTARVDCYSQTVDIQVKPASGESNIRMPTNPNMDPDERFFAVIQLPPITFARLVNACVCKMVRSQ